MALGGRLMVSGCLAGVLVVLSAGFLSAQRPLQVRVAPRIGLVDPGERLYNAHAISDSDRLVSSTAGLRTSESVGLAVDVGSEAWGAMLQISVTHAPDVASTVIVHHYPPSLGIGDGSTYRAGFTGSVTELGADLVLPLRLDIGPFRPFAVAGLGWTRYRFSSPEFDVSPFRGWVLPASGTASNYRLGGGITFSVLGRDVSLSVIDRIGSYFDETQHHVLASVDIWFDVFN